MTDEDAGAVAPEPVKRGPGRPRKEMTISATPPTDGVPVRDAPLSERTQFTIVDVAPVRVRLLRPVQLNSECFADRPERPAKLIPGDTPLLQQAVAAGLIASGKAVRV